MQFSGTFWLPGNVKKTLEESLSDMEYTGFEPVASTMRMLRAPNCANTPMEDIITYIKIKRKRKE